MGEYILKILMLVNWKIEYNINRPADKQPPNCYISGEKYWFFRYFKEPVEVDVLDIHSLKWIENIEKNKLRFYVIQTLRALPKLKNYDLILSHGMQSGVLLAVYRRIFKTKAKHIVFDIGSFNSAAESGFALKLMQFASKSINGIIYHTSTQIDYYKKFFPWIVDKSKFIRFGTDLEFFNPEKLKKSEDVDSYILCVGYSKRDWDTLVQAYKLIDTDVKLRLIGNDDKKYSKIMGVEQVSFISISDLINQIYNALFCVLPLESFNYSYGQMTLMQQMALGKLVITARVPSLIDYVEDNKTALLYEPKNVESCAEKMKSALTDTQLKKNIQVNGRQYVKVRCNEKIMASEIETYLMTNV
jgi:glycosyltransferase involved in cell wall biosynthesis